MRTKLETLITKFATIVEILISVIIVAAVLLASFSLIQELGFFSGQLIDFSNFDQFLGHVISLVVGIEFIKMLIKRTPGAVIEVLLYAIARQIIVYHSNTIETLLGVLAVAGIFAVRKFLFIHSFEGDDDEIPLR